jgi:type I restriction-modification system DNA methylase subunit
MNNKQFEKLWRLADKLRGAFEISELYKVMLYGVLLKHVECEKEFIKSYDEKYSLGYLSLTYGKIVKAYDILDYLRKLESELRLDVGVISESFDQVFSRVDSESVRIIFESLNELNITSKEECYQFAQLLVNKMMTSSGRFGSEFGTNLDLAKLEAALLDVQEGMTVYDAYCGTGIAVNEVAAGKGTVFMQDMNISSIGIAAIMSVLSSNRIGAVRCADSLHNPIELKGQYDRVVCEPPFGVRYEKYYLETMPKGNTIYQESMDSDSLALRHAIASLKKDGVAVVLVPMGMLFKSGRMGDVRKNLVEDSYIDAIIELPNGIITGTAVATALVVLKNNKETSEIMMINAKDFCTKADRATVIITEENIHRIATIYRNREVIEGVSNTITKEEAANNSYNLCTTQYVTLKASEGIVVEDNAKFVENYEELLQRLGAIDKELDSVRSRFVKEG